jgi:hypothetical protein
LTTPPPCVGPGTGGMPGAYIGRPPTPEPYEPPPPPPASGGGGAKTEGTSGRAPLTVGKAGMLGPLPKPGISTLAFLAVGRFPADGGGRLLPAASSSSDESPSEDEPSGDDEGAAFFLRPPPPRAAPPAAALPPAAAVDEVEATGSGIPATCSCRKSNIGVLSIVRFLSSQKRRRATGSVRRGATRRGETLGDKQVVGRHLLAAGRTSLLGRGADKRGHEELERLCWMRRKFNKADVSER